MNESIFLLVEGDGDKIAAPKLVWRILAEYYDHYFDIVAKQAQGADDLSKNLEKYLERIRSERERCQGLLILRDVEKDNCAVDLARDFASRAKKLNLPFPVVIVFAMCEYESWFLASLDTIARNSQFKWTKPFEVVDNPEAECSAKGFLKRHMPEDAGTYKETRDQVKMTDSLDLRHVHKQCRSFRRMVHAVGELMDAIRDQKEYFVSPFQSDEN